jgi:hypothetical protein
MSMRAFLSSSSCTGLLFSELNKTARRTGTLAAVSTSERMNEMQRDTEPPPKKRQCSLFTHYKRNTQAPGRLAAVVQH